MFYHIQFAEANCNRLFAYSCM